MSAILLPYLIILDNFRDWILINWVTKIMLRICNLCWLRSLRCLGTSWRRTRRLLTLWCTWPCWTCRRRSRGAGSSCSCCWGWCSSGRSGCNRTRGHRKTCCNSKSGFFLDHLKKTQGRENSSLKKITQNSSKILKVSADFWFLYF